MKYAIKPAAALSILMLVASCGSFDGKSSGSPKSASDLPNGPQSIVSDTPVRLGSPFVVGNTTYTPTDPISYDEVGYASYYGSELAGRPTANGEIFMPAGITAAHKTLPMPSYVEVTSLDTGRTILVRVNDRGPFSNDRLIDLSEGAARQLGITAQGVSGVRVRRVNPPESERALLRTGSQAAERIETPESLLKVLRDKLAKMARPSGTSTAPVSRPATTPSGPVNTPAPASGDDRFIHEGGKNGGAKTVPVYRPAPSKPVQEVTVTADGGGYIVQIGSFSSRSRADQIARKAGAKVVASSDGRLFRVRYGPYATVEEAQRGLATAKQRGYPQAAVLRN